MFGEMMFTKGILRKRFLKTPPSLLDLHFKSHLSKIKLRSSKRSFKGLLGEEAAKAFYIFFLSFRVGVKLLYVKCLLKVNKVLVWILFLCYVFLSPTDFC